MKPDKKKDSLNEFKLMTISHDYMILTHGKRITELEKKVLELSKHGK